MYHIKIKFPPSLISKLVFVDNLLPFYGFFAIFLVLKVEGFFFALFPLFSSEATQ